MITGQNFSKFNGCARQAYLLVNDKEYKSLRDKNLLSGRLRDVQRDMLKSFPCGVSVYGDVKHAAEDTLNIMQKGEDVIFGGVVKWENCNAKCDVLMRNGDVYDIYAVRPTSRYTRWIDELLFAKIIMQKANMPVGNCYVCAIDREGGRGKRLNLFEVDNEKRREKLQEKLERILKYISREKMPEKKLVRQCGSCPYMGFCFGNDPDSIFSLKSLQFNKKMSLYQKGIKTVSAYVKTKDCDERALREIAVRNTDDDIYNVAEIRNFLENLSYPLGFLDFETMEVFKPEDPVLSPMDTVITQFSYHLIEKEGETAKHYEFIGDGVSYCEREAAEKLIEYIKPEHTVLMYSDYEKVCIERVMKRLPEYSADLEKIKENLVDLEKPFAKKYLVNRRMDGKSSLKKVLPALYPEDDSLDYSKMKIQNGQQAESVYARLHRMGEKEREEAIRDLKEYCALDTLAMIKLWEKLEFYGNMS